MAGLMCCIDRMACCNDNCWLFLDRARYSSKFTVARVDTELDSRRLMVYEKNADDSIGQGAMYVAIVQIYNSCPRPHVGVQIGEVYSSPHLRAS